MQLSPESWPTVSALLDEALALPAAERDTWLQSLDGERAALKDTLRELLSRASGVESEDFFATLPRFTRVSAANVSGLVTELSADDAIGPYKLISELGTGGMGAVWLAERSDGTLKRKVALKLPRTVWAKGLAERMARERDILATLEHPNIARLYDAGVDQHGRPYLALEYVEGQPIDVYAKERALTVRQKLDLLLQVCAAVAFAHSRLVVHRDLKPSNIMVTADGQVRLLDFGIAKLMEGDSTKETQLTHMAGRALTLDYASPEQIKGEPIGTASDVYSLGVVAYELLTGGKPYKLKRGSAAELEEVIATSDPPRASEAASEPSARKSLKGDLDAILNKALKKAPEERYPTVDAFAEDARRHLGGEPVAAAPDSLTYRARKFVARHKAASAVIALLLAGVAGGAYAQVVVMIALAVGIGVALWQRNRAKDAAAQARAQAVVAEQERARATQVKDFLLRLLVESDTDSGSTAQTTVAQLLRRASVDIDAALSLDGDAMLQLKTALASALTSLGEPAEAVKLLEPAVLALSDAQKDSPLGLFACFRYGEALHGSRRTEAAIGTLRDVATRARQKASLAVEVQTKQQLSSALIDAGRMDDAVVAIRDAVAGAERLDVHEHALLRAHVFASEVNVLRSSGQPGVLPAARRALEAALRSDKVGLAPRAVADVMLADAEVTEGNLQHGIARYGAVEKQFIESHGVDHPLTAMFHLWFGTALLTWGDLQNAARQFDAVIASSRRTPGEAALEEALAELCFARADALLNDPASAVERLHKAGSILGQLPKNPALAARLRDQHVLLALEQGVMPPAEAVSEDYWRQPPADDTTRAQWGVRRLGVDQLSGRPIARDAIREAADGLILFLIQKANI